MATGRPGDVRAGGAYVEVYARGIAALNQQMADTDRKFKSFGSTVSNTLSGFTKSAGMAALSASRMSETLNRSMWLLTSGFGNLYRSIQQIATTMSQSLKTARNYTAAVAMTGIGGWAKTLSYYSQYERQMATLRAVTNANTKDFDRLSQSVRHFGANTRYETFEIAQLQTELARAGQSIDEIIKNTEGTINLAITGEVSTEEAARIAANITNATKESMDKIADLLAKGANISSAEVIDLANSFRYVSASANMTNMDIEKTMTLLAMLSNYNMRGTTGGRSLGQAMVRVSAGANAQRFRKLGVEVENSDKTLRSFEQVLFDVYDAFERKGMTPAEQLEFMRLTFGQVGMRAAAIIGSNRREFEKMYKEMDNVTGAATLMAKIMGATLYGDVKKLESVFRDLQITLGEQIAPIITPIIKSMTDLARKINELAKANPEFAEKVFALTGVFAVMAGALTSATVALGVFGVSITPITTALIAVGAAVNTLVFSFGGLSSILSTGVLASIDMVTLGLGGMLALMRGGTATATGVGVALTGVGSAIAGAASAGMAANAASREAARQAARNAATQEAYLQAKLLSEIAADAADFNKREMARIRQTARSSGVPASVLRGITDPNDAIRAIRTSTVVSPFSSLDTALTNSAGRISTNAASLAARRAGVAAAAAAGATPASTPLITRILSTVTKLLRPFGLGLMKISGILLRLIPVVGQVTLAIDILRLLLWTFNGFTSSGNAFLQTLNAIMKPIDAFFAMLVKWAWSAMKVILPGFSAGIVSSGKIISLFFGMISKAVSTTVNIVGSAVSALFDQVTRLLDVFKSNPTFLNDYFTVLIDMVKNGDWEGLGDMLKRTFDTIVAGIKLFAGVFVVTFKTMFELIFNELTGLFDQFKHTVVIVFYDTKEQLLRSVGLEMSHEDIARRDYAEADFREAVKRTEKDREAILSGSTMRYDTVTEKMYDTANMTDEQLIQRQARADRFMAIRMAKTLEPTPANAKNLRQYLKNNGLLTDEAKESLDRAVEKVDRDVKSSLALGIFGRKILGDKVDRDPDEIRDLMSAAAHSVPMRLSNEEVQRRITSGEVPVMDTLTPKVDYSGIQSMVQNDPMVSALFNDFQYAFRMMNNPIQRRANEIRGEGLTQEQIEDMELASLERRVKYLDSATFRDGNRPANEWLQVKKEFEIRSQQIKLDRQQRAEDAAYLSLYKGEMPPEYESAFSKKNAMMPTFKQSDLETRSSVGTFSSFNFGQLQQTTWQRTVERLLGDIANNTRDTAEAVQEGAVD